MKLLVSGHESIGVVDWSTGSQAAVRVPDDFFFHDAYLASCQQPIRTFGLTWNDTSILVACHERVGCFNRHLEHTGFADISPLWLMTHSLAYRDEVLYTCNSRVDLVGVHDLASGGERFLDVVSGHIVGYPKNIRPIVDGYRYDSHHPNAVLVTDEIVYVLVHAIDRQRLVTDIRAFDRDKLVLRDQLRINARPVGSPYLHDLALRDGVFYWCNTHLCRVESSGGQVSDTLGDASMFLRGLALADGDIFVGLATRKGPALADQDVCIVQLDRASMREVRRERIDFEVEICALRLLDAYDYGHWNRALPDVLVKSTRHKGADR